MSEEWLVKNGNNYNAKAQVFRGFFHLYKPIKKQSKKRNIKNIKKHGEYLPNKL